MDSAVYNRAVVRIAELQAELRRLEVFVATYRELAAVASEPAPTQQPVPNAAAAEKSGPGDAAPPRATPQVELERVVEQVLLSSGAPLRRMALLELVKAQGIIIGGRNEATNFGSKLSRAARLVNLPKLGYWPKDKPFEPGGYQPDIAGLPAA